MYSMFAEETILIVLFAVQCIAKFGSFREHVAINCLRFVMQLALVSAAGCFGVSRFNFFLYMCVVAEAALQLGVRPLAAVIVFAFVAHVVDQQVRIAGFLHHGREQLQNVSSVHPIFVGEALLFFLFSMGTVVALMRSFLSEKSSRVRAERLSAEMEEMTAKQERARIAREIHDAVGHTLTSLRLDIEERTATCCGYD